MTNSKPVPECRAVNKKVGGPHLWGSEHVVPRSALLLTDRNDPKPWHRGVGSLFPQRLEASPARVPEGPPEAYRSKTCYFVTTECNLYVINEKSPVVRATGLLMLVTNPLKDLT